MSKYKTLQIRYSTLCAGRMSLCTAAFTLGQILRDQQWWGTDTLIEKGVRPASSCVSANIMHTARHKKKRNKGDNSNCLCPLVFSTAD